MLYDWKQVSAGDLERELSYSEVKTGKNGMKTVDVKVARDPPMRLCVQTPKMRVPFGVSYYQGDIKTAKLSFEFEEGSPFHAFCLMLDAANLKFAAKTQDALFGTRNKKPELLAEKQYKIVTESKSGYAPSLRAKVPFDGDRCTTIIVDENHKMQTIDDLPRKVQAIGIIEFNGLWSTATGWGMTVRLVQLKYYESAEESTALLFTE